MENKMITIREALKRKPHLYRMCNPENENFQRIVFPDTLFISPVDGEPFEVLFILTGRNTDSVFVKEEEKDVPCLLPIPDEIFH